MPFYVKEVETSADSTNEVKFKVWSGVIHQVSVMFPPGCASLLKVSIWHGGHQIYPSTELQYFAGDGETIPFRDHYKLHVGLNQITIKTKNEDTQYSHACRVRLGILPGWLLDPTGPFRRISGSLATLLRRIGAT